MGSRSLLTALALAALVAAPAIAEDGQRRQPRDEGQPPQGARPSEQAAPRERAVARATEQPRRTEQNQRADQNRRAEQNQRAEENRRAEQNQRADENRRAEQNRRADENRRVEQNNRNQQAQRDQQIRRDQQARRDSDSRRQYDNRGYDNNRSSNNRSYDNRSYTTNRGYDSGRTNGWRFPTRRVVRPSIVRVIPYRPYVYRPSYGIGVYYGSGGYYPYGVTPRGYYDPIPGRYYGGVRITGAPRDARVFADGYYVGIVNDFDGIFQHMNLEAGGHHIEIDWGGYEPIAFDVYVRPGETTTFRADGFFARY